MLTLVNFKVYLDAHGPLVWKDLMADFQCEVISAALNLNHGNTAQTARMLGIGRTTLVEKMKTLGIQWENGDVTIGVSDENL